MTSHEIIDPAIQITQEIVSNGIPVMLLTQIVLAVLVGIAIWWAYREWRYHQGLTPIRHGDFIGKLPHVKVKFKFTAFELDKTVNKETIEDLRKLQLPDRIVTDYGLGPKDKPTMIMSEMSGAAIANTKPAVAQAPARHTLADILEKNEHIHYYVGQCLMTEGSNIAGYIMVATNGQIEDSHLSMQLVDNFNLFKGYHTTIKELVDSGPKGFIIRNPRKEWHGHEIAAFIYYDLRPVKPGTTATKEEIETLNVSMSMMTTLEAVVKALHLTHFNERFAQQVQKLKKRSDDIALSMSLRAEELAQAQSTEPYDNVMAKTPEKSLNAILASGIMFGGTLVLFEVLRRNMPPPPGFTENPMALFLAGAISFGAVLVAYVFAKK